jgi:NAD(P)-dependent dehydrogenase (short-subunit alcohol dehydrogenase family)
MDPSSASLAGRTALVTGAGAGIGRAIARVMAAFGARVAVLDRDADSARRTAADITGAGGEALAVHADAREPEAVDAALDATAAQLGLVDVLVNNAGGVFAAPFLEAAPKGWHALWRANLESVLHCTQRVARRLVDSGRAGSIINVVSIEGVRAAPMYAAYAAAKAGAISATRTLALELAPHAIRVNAIAPDICLTEGLEALVPPGDRGRWNHIVPLGRPGEPDDIAGAAVFLACDLSRYVTGITLHVDGGTQAACGWYRDPGDGAWVLGPGRGTRQV